MFSGVVSGYSVADRERVGGKLKVLNMLETFVSHRCPKVGEADIPSALLPFVGGHGQPNPLHMLGHIDDADCISVNLV